MLLAIVHRQKHSLVSPPPILLYRPQSIICCTKTPLQPVECNLRTMTCVVITNHNTCNQGVNMTSIRLPWWRQTPVFHCPDRRHFRGTMWQGIGRWKGWGAAYLQGKVRCAKGSDVTDRPQQFLLSTVTVSWSDGAAIPTPPRDALTLYWSSKRRYTSTRLYGVTARKTATWTITAIKI